MSGEPVQPPEPPAPDAAPRPAAPSPPRRAWGFLRERVHLDNLAWPVAMVCFLAWQVWRLVMGPLGQLGDLSTEETVVGLMARRVMDGEWPQAWVWGRPGVAALEPILAVGVFSLWGESLATLRAIPFVTVLLASAVTLALVTRVMGGRAALVAALCMAVAFPEPVSLSLRALGSVSTSGFAGVVALWAAAGVSVDRPARLSLAAGVAAGVCLWCGPAFLPLTLGALVALAMGLCAAVVVPSRWLTAAMHGARFTVGTVVGAGPRLAAFGEDAIRDAWSIPAQAADQYSAPDILSFLETASGAPAAPGMVLALMVLCVPGLVRRLLQRGLADAGARAAVGAWVTALAAATLTIRAVPASGLEAALRLVPLWWSVPVVAAAAAWTVGGQLSALALASALLLQVRGPQVQAGQGEGGADNPVEPVVAFLNAHPQACYASAAVAYRVALLSSETHRCVAITGPDYLPGWRVDAAAGPRAYFFAVEEVERARRLERDLTQLGLSFRRSVAGAYLVRMTGGVPWPPRVRPVEWEHARRESRVVVDADLLTSVEIRPGRALRLELVWPAVLRDVSYWQDVTQLQRAPCVVRGSIITPEGRKVPGPPRSLHRSCLPARDWALWPLQSLEVRLPLPSVLAAQVLLEGLDSERTGRVLAVSEARVRPQEWRVRLARDKPGQGGREEEAPR